MESDRPETAQTNRSSEAARYYALRARKNLRLDLILRAYTILGGMLAVVGMLYFIFTLVAIDVTPSQQIALITFGTGSVVSLMSWVIITVRRQREKYEVALMRNYVAVGELIHLWSAFEQLSKGILVSEGEDFRRYSLRTVIVALHSDKWIDDEDLRTLYEALEIRNIIVHGGAQIPENIVDKVTRDLSVILAKLAHHPNGTMPQPQASMRQ